MANHRHLAPESWQRAYADTACCPRCTLAAPRIYVHGHAQCTACGSNIAECCQGSGYDLAPAGRDTAR